MSTRIQPVRRAAGLRKLVNTVPGFDSEGHRHELFRAKRALDKGSDDFEALPKKTQDSIEAEYKKVKAERATAQAAATAAAIKKQKREEQLAARRKRSSKLNKELSSTLR